MLEFISNIRSRTNFRGRGGDVNSSAVGSRLARLQPPSSSCFIGSSMLRSTCALELRCWGSRSLRSGPVDDHATAPLVIMASTTGTTFLHTATEVIETIEFLN